MPSATAPAGRRRPIILACTAAILVCASAWLLLPAQPTSIPPNVLLILIDTLRADHLAAYGYSVDTAPNLERLARNGVLFERVIAPSSWTKTSMASIITGLNPLDHGVRGPHDVLPVQLDTLAEAFAAAGYFTIGVNTNPWLQIGYGFDAGFDVYETFKPDNAPFETAGNVTREALALLKRAPTDRPTFLYVHYMDAHAPYRPMPGFPSEPPLVDPDGNPMPDDKLEFLYREEALDFPGVQQRVLDLYDAGIRTVDDAIGTLLSELSTMGWDRNVVIAVTSDHGEAFREHGTAEHGRNLYPEVYRVPLIFSAPSKLHPGQRIQSQVRGIDVAPTLLSLAGIDPPDSCRGEPLLPVKSGDVRERVAVSAVGLNDAIPHLDYVALVSEDYLYVRERQNDRMEFYDLRTDPGARDDLGANHPQAKRFRDLEEHLGTATALRKELDPQTIEQLKALGYMD